MGSTRLPGKILLPIAGRPLLEHVLARLDGLRAEGTVVVATTDRQQDDVVEQFCRERGTAFFRGSESNVLERFFRCAQRYEFTQIVRLTADNPFTDIEELDRLIEFHVENGFDFSHSFKSLPIGVGAEIFTFAALETSFKEGHAAHHLEHVDEYMLENPVKFRTGQPSANAGKCRPDVRLTVDTSADYQRACFIAESSRHEHVTTQEAISLCTRFA